MRGYRLSLPAEAPRADEGAAKNVEQSAGIGGNVQVARAAAIENASAAAGG